MPDTGRGRPGDPEGEPLDEATTTPSDGTPPEPAPPEPALPGTTPPDVAADAVRSALNRARAAAAARGLSPGRPGSSGGAVGDVAGRGSAAQRRRRSTTWMSGAGPDDRDPQTASTSIRRLVGELGWSAPVAVGGVVGRWEQVVGPEVAAHATPETFTDGVLSVRADSTAWATQLRMLLPVVQRRLDEELGEGVVRQLRVRGPGAPSWRRGGRRAAGGRGPRDTYG